MEKSVEAIQCAVLLIGSGWVLILLLTCKLAASEARNTIKSSQFPQTLNLSSSLWTPLTGSFLFGRHYLFLTCTLEKHAHRY
jgi:hypothetical protein